MIRDVVVLADETAHVRVGGLLQIDRLLRSIEELAATTPAVAEGGLRVWVVWRRSSLGAATADRVAASALDIRDVVIEPDEDARPHDWASELRGQTLLLSSGLILGRHALAGCLASSTDDGGHVPPVAVLDGPSVRELAQGGDPWRQLSGRLPEPDEVACRGARFCTVLDGADDVPRAEAALFASLGKETDGVVARHLNRPLSTRISRYLSRFPVTPNNITAVLALIALGGAWSLAQGTYLGFVLGTLVYHIVSVLDGCDGEIARAKFLETNFGSWLDTISDSAGHHLFVAALGVGLARQPGLTPGWRWFFLVEGLLTVLAMIVTYRVVAHYTHLKRADQRHFSDFGSSLVKESGVSRGKSPLLVIVQIFRRDFYNLLYVFVALLGQASLVLHAMAIGTVGHLLASLLGVRHRRSEQDEDDSRPAAPVARNPLPSETR